MHQYGADVGRVVYDECITPVLAEKTNCDQKRASQALDMSVVLLSLTVHRNKRQS